MQSFTLKLAAAAVAAACILPGIASASGGGSGPNVQYAVQGKIGEVITNRTRSRRSRPSSATAATSSRMPQSASFPSTAAPKSSTT